jgi:hypothetical protein
MIEKGSGTQPRALRFTVQKAAVDNGIVKQLP